MRTILLLAISFPLLGQMFPFPGPGLPASGGPPPTPTFISPLNHVGFASGSPPFQITITNTGASGGSPVTPSVGETLIISMYGSQSSTSLSVSSCTDNQTPANTYVVDKQITNATTTSVNAALISTKITTASGTFTVTCTTSGGSFYGMNLARFSNLNVTVDGNSSVDSSVATNIPCGSFTPTAGEVMVVAAVFADSTAGSVTSVAAGGTPGTYIIPTNGSNNSGASFSVGGFEYQIITSTSGAYAPAFTLGSAGTFSSCAAVGYKQ